MENTRISSGVVAPILGSIVTDANGFANQFKTYTGVASNITGASKYKDSPFATYQAVVTGTGAVTATVNIYGSNDGVNFCATALGTITLTGTSPQSDGFTTQSPWKYVRAVLSNLTGTNASCYVLQGV